MIKKKCIVCEKEFETKYSSQKHCSSRCRNKLYYQRKGKKVLRRYYEKNKDKIRIRKREWGREYRKKPEVKLKKRLLAKKYSEKYPEKIKARKEKYMSSEKGKETIYKYNRSKSRKTSSKRYEQSDKGKSCVKKYLNSGKGKATKKKYYQTETYGKNRRHGVRKYRAKKRKLIHSFTKKEWEKLLKLTKGICPRCNKFVGIDKMELDHIVPISKVIEGFVYNIKDVQPLCMPCNRSKGARIKAL
ncbi:MAG: HNH endonuclease signature motif containing protein [archaeon]